METRRNTLKRRQKRRTHPARRQKKKVKMNNTNTGVHEADLTIIAEQSNPEEVQCVSTANISSTTSQSINEGSSSNLNNEEMDINLNSSNIEVDNMTDISPEVPTPLCNSLDTASLVLGDESTVTTSESSSCNDVVNQHTSNEDLECPICLQTCVFPAKLPCSHVFCYLCIKGVVCARQLCPMCRTVIPQNFNINPNLIPLVTSSNEEMQEDTEESHYAWFYEGRRGGWWQFENRMSNEIEENKNCGNTLFEMMICGELYVIDTLSKIQYPKDNPRKIRKILRDVPSEVDVKGVAGISRRNLPSTSSPTKTMKNTCLPDA